MLLLKAYIKEGIAYHPEIVIWNEKQKILNLLKLHEFTNISQFYDRLSISRFFESVRWLKHKGDKQKIPRPFCMTRSKTQHRWRLRTWDFQSKPLLQSAAWDIYNQNKNVVLVPPQNVSQSCLFYFTFLYLEGYRVGGGGAGSSL